MAKRQIIKVILHEPEDKLLKYPVQKVNDFWSEAILKKIRESGVNQEVILERIEILLRNIKESPVGDKKTGMSRIDSEHL